VINYPPAISEEANGIIITLKRCIKGSGEDKFNCITLVKTRSTDGKITTEATDGEGTHVDIYDDTGIPKEWNEYPIPIDWQKAVEGNHDDDTEEGAEAGAGAGAGGGGAGAGAGAGA
jgi:hypothetical protein